MGVEQRIIGGGLLIAGIAICLILVFVFGGFGGDITPGEARTQVLSELFPRYERYVKGKNYHEARKVATEIESVIASGGAVNVKKLITADATTNRVAKRLHKLIRADAFAKNTENRWEFENKWFSGRTCALLRDLQAAVEDGAIKPYREAVRTAEATTEMIALARTASAKALEAKVPALPAGAPQTLTALNELFSVYSVSVEEMTAGLATPAPAAGKSRSARIKWNRTASKTDLPKRVRQLVAQSKALRTAGGNIERLGETLKSDAEADAVVARFLTQAATAVGGKLDDAARKSLADHVMLASYLRGLASIVEQHTGSTNELSPLFEVEFKL
ncbi:MAG: hypothetical protein V3T86_13210 [Planctomycetota bacterium]